jgi:hypothetical protein
MSSSNRAQDSVQIALADSSLCEAACCEIYAQRPRWYAFRLNKQPRFYTLGAASYLDLGFAIRSIDDYLADAGLLWEWAGDAVLTILERVRDAMSKHLDQSVEYARVLPPPGFHIFLGAGIPKSDCARRVENCASCHFDLQFQKIPWTRWYRNVRLEETISFTLALKLPAAGGGLTIWESLTRQRLRADLAAGRFPNILAAANATPDRTIPYAVGSMVVHSGQVLHRIAGVSRVSVTDERITLQGHGVLADGTWRLYW